MLSLYFVHYNFVRMPNTLRMTPALAAGVTDTLHDVTWLVGILNADAPKPDPTARNITRTETLPECVDRQGLGKILLNLGAPVIQL
jgi:hypothetical protein